METKSIKFVVFVPITHADAVRQALGEAGAGKIGNYDFCSFSSRGTGRFRGNERTNPTIGEAPRPSGRGFSRDGVPWSGTPHRKPFIHGLPPVAFWCVGKAGKYESVEEEKIEVIVPREILDEVIKKVKAVHPYEEVAFDIYPIEN